MAPDACRGTGLMARRTRREAEATRESLLDAAEDCFREQGLFRTSLEAIATRAGVTRGAVYWHFKNKDEVLEAVINRVSVPFFHGLERVSRADGNTPLRDLRRMLCRSFADLVHNERVRSAIEVIELRSEVAVEDDAISRLRTTGMRETRARIAAAFRRAETLGQLRPGRTPDQCARSLHVVIAGAVRMFLLDPASFELERDGLAVVDLILHAVAEFPADDGDSRESTGTG